MTCKSIKEALERLAESFECEEYENFILVNTPFEYPDGDLIQLYIPKNENKIVITDFGETISNLMTHNYDVFSTKKREKIFYQILNNLGINYSKGELRIENPPDLTEAIIRLIEGCMRIGDLIFTQRITGKATFKEEVSGFLFENKIPFKENFQEEGYTGNKYKIDFYIYVEPPSLLQTLSSRIEGYAETLIDRTFTMWYDLKRKDGNYKFITLLDDTYDVWKKSKLRLLEDYSKVYYWSERDKMKEELLAIV